MREEPKTWHDINKKQISNDNTSDHGAPVHPLIWINDYAKAHVCMEKQRDVTLGICCLLGAALGHPIDAQQAGKEVIRGSEGLRLPIYGHFVEQRKSTLRPIH